MNSTPLSTQPQPVQQVVLPHLPVTVVDGTSFCVSSSNGRISPERAEGLFVRDTRVLSTWKWTIDGAGIEALTVIAGEPYECRFVGRAGVRSDNPESTVVVERHRWLARGLHEAITVTNFGTEPAGLRLVLTVGADFADVFEVKSEHRVRSRRHVHHTHTAAELTYAWTNEGETRGVHIRGDGAVIAPHSLTFSALVEPGERWSTTVEVIPSINNVRVHEADHPYATTTPAERMRGWRNALPIIAVENPVLAQALLTSERDLGALRIVDPDHPSDDVIAAGAPWFMALFGRDSLLTSSLFMPFAPDLALGTLRTLARLQGHADNPMTEEQPGKILHEVRVGADLSLALGGESVYYGSIDSTPLFVTLVGQALHRGIPASDLADLREAVDRAIEWIDARTGPAGFVSYRRSSDRGLQNQGWKDSVDGVGFADGTYARAPIALAEVQGYAYAALRAGADLASAWGEPDVAAGRRERARALKARFHDAFWMPGEGFYAMALDRDGRQVDSITSNIGHCLWAGIVPQAHADAVVDRLLRPDMFTGFGIRTLSALTGGYNPASYHRGSVWPHDTAIVASGMARYGRSDAAQRVAGGLLGALEAFDGRLPELFCGFDRDATGSPIPYPTSCSPQAWAAVVPFELLRLLTGLTMDIPAGRITATPTPVWVGRVRMQNLQVADSPIQFQADPVGVSLHGLPPSLTLTGA